MIVVTDVNKSFGTLKALRHVHVNCQPGECIALIGPNGCGKTTLIKSILGMVLPDSGKITFDGQPVQQSYQYRGRIGYMPQIGRYPDNMTVKQVLDTIKNLRSSIKNPDTQLYDAYQIKDILHKRMRTLSGGTRQKVSATLASLFNPDVLILDEPTAGLDPLAAEILKDYILQQTSRNKLVLITSHLLSELDNLVTEVVFMQDGAIKFHKSTASLKQETSGSTLAQAITLVLKQNRA